LARMLGSDQRHWLLGAAVCWSLAFMTLAVLLWQARGAHPDSGRRGADTD